MIWSIYSSSNDGSLMEHQMIRSWWDRDNIITIALTAKNDFFRFYRKSNEEMNNINYEAISRWCCDIEHILIFSAALLSSSPISFFFPHLFDPFYFMFVVHFFYPAHTISPSTPCPLDSSIVLSVIDLPSCLVNAFKCQENCSHALFIVRHISMMSIT